MLEAGRELDAEVAEKVMNYEWREWPLNREQPHLVPPGYEDPHKLVWWLGRSVQELVPNFSTDIATAWQVVEKLKGRVVIDHWYGDTYKVMVYIPSTSRPSVEALAETAPLAICRAALATVSRSSAASDVASPES